MKKLLLILFVLLPTLALAKLVPAQHKDGKWGYKTYSYAEKFTIKPKYEKAHDFAKSYAFVCHKGLWGIIGEDGKFVVKPMYASATPPYYGLTIVGLNGKFGIVNSNGSPVIPISCDGIEPYAYNTFLVKVNGKYG